MKFSSSENSLLWEMQTYKQPSNLHELNTLLYAFVWVSYHAYISLKVSMQTMVGSQSQIMTRNMCNQILNQAKLEKENTLIFSRISDFFSLAKSASSLSKRTAAFWFVVTNHFWSITIATPEPTTSLNRFTNCSYKSVLIPGICGTYEKMNTTLEKEVKQKKILHAKVEYTTLARQQNFSDGGWSELAGSFRNIHEKSKFPCSLIIDYEGW